MAILDLAHLDATTAVAMRAADRACLEHARASGRCVLAAATPPGDVLALGRFHQRPPDDVPDVALLRRTTGGRACALGDGFVRLVLALPHRSALVADQLAPEQVLNRAVRGPMAALQQRGIAVQYPGRDLLTVAGKPLGVLGLAIEDDGATLVDLVLAVGRDFALLPHLLDRADRAGVVRAGMIDAGAVTSLVRLGCTLDAGVLLADAARGYAERLGVSPGETIALASPATAADADWQAARRPDARHTHHATTPTALGVLEAHVALAPDATIADVRLAGDVFASAAAMRAVEAGLRGEPLALDRVSAAVETALASSDGVLLGVSARAVAETVAAVLVRRRAAV
jgi:hypothetical protein